MWTSLPPASSALSFDLDRYLARIGWQGPRAASFETLAGVLRAHMTRIPFENLDVLLGRGVRLDLDGVFAKLVAAGRGGYCFEHGTLLQAALERLGFRPTAFAARVVMLTPKMDAPRTHMFLAVPVGEETYVLDPGFGGHGALVPVPLADGDETRDGADVHRMVRRDDEWVLEARIGDLMAPLWSSTLEPQYPVDFAVANHFVATFPTSPFVTRLMLRAIVPDGRVSVMNREVTLRRGTREEKSVLADRTALRSLITEHFGFDLPELERLRVPSVPEWT